MLQKKLQSATKEVQKVLQSATKKLQSATKIYRMCYYGLWTMDFGLWTLDYGLWTMDFELWTMDFGLRSNVELLSTQLATGERQLIHEHKENVDFSVGSRTGSSRIHCQHTHD